MAQFILCYEISRFGWEYHLYEKYRCLQQLNFLFYISTLLILDISIVYRAEANTMSCST